MGCADVKIHFVFEAFDESFLHSSHEALKKNKKKEIKVEKIGQKNWFSEHTSIV